MHKENIEYIISIRKWWNYQSSYNTVWLEDADDSLQCFISNTPGGMLSFEL